MSEPASRRILLLGAGGQLGRELALTLPALGAVTPADRSAVDLRDAGSVRAVMERLRPAVVVNAAAYTAVDRAESEPELAWAVNAVAPGILAEEAERLGACLVHYSTDYVFDGESATAYDEEDETNPLSVYGRSKREGERAVRAACRRHLILRTSWVFGVHGSNFLKTMLRLASERDVVRVVSDQAGTPTAARLIADATGTALTSLLRDDAEERRWGLYHLTADGSTTWHAYARYVVEKARALGFGLRAGPDQILPIGTAEYPTPARRPANSRLDTRRFRTAFGVTLPPWTTGVDDVLDALGRAAHGH